MHTQTVQWLLIADDLSSCRIQFLFLLFIFIVKLKRKKKEKTNATVGLCEVLNHQQPKLT